MYFVDLIGVTSNLIPLCLGTILPYLLKTSLPTQVLFSQAFTCRFLSLVAVLGTQVCQYVFTNTIPRQSTYYWCSLTNIKLKTVCFCVYFCLPACFFVAASHHWVIFCLWSAKIYPDLFHCPLPTYIYSMPFIFPIQIKNFAFILLKILPAGFCPSFKLLEILPNP